MMKPSTDDKTTGKLHEVKGAIKQKAGELTKNPNPEADGKAEKTAEKVKNFVGKVEKAIGNKEIRIILRDNGGQEIMTESIFEQASEQIADTAHKASRAASAAAEALEDGVGQRGVPQNTVAMPPQSCCMT